MGITSFLTTTVLVQKRTTSRTSMGGSKQTFSTRIASLQCRLRRSQQDEVEVYGKMTVTGLWRLYCVADSDGLSIEETDRIVWGRGSTSKTYQVKTIYNPGQLDRHLEIDILEIL